MFRKARRKIKKTVISFKYYGFKYTMSKIYRSIMAHFRTPYGLWKSLRTPSVFKLRKQKKMGQGNGPKFSYIVITGSDKCRDLEKSFNRQTYTNYELIKVVSIEEINEIIPKTKGAYIGFLMPNDRLLPYTLYEIARAIESEQNADLIYTDHDYIVRGIRKKPVFKPDFSIDYLRSNNYIGRTLLFSRQIIEKIGVVNIDYSVAWFWDYTLRACEMSKHIVHIPDVLYSMGDAPSLNCEEEYRNVLEEHLERMGTPGKAYMDSKATGCFRIKYSLKKEPKVSIIIPNKDHVEDLDRCLMSIIKKQKYTNYEVLIVENNSENDETFAYYDKIKNKYPVVKILYWDKEFNYSAINNFAVDNAEGECILLLNNDTQMQHENNIQELVSNVMRPEVGIVGARLFYEDGTIQHAGVIMGYGGLADHAFCGRAGDDSGYGNRIITTSNLSAVTAACLMVRKEIYLQVGGLEERLKIAFNDVDFCLKVRDAGYLVVYNPYVRLFHYESKSRGIEDTSEKVKRFEGEVAFAKEKWKGLIEKGDPYYNVNLTLGRKDFSIKNWSDK